MIYLKTCSEMESSMEKMSRFFLKYHSWKQSRGAPEHCHFKLPFLVRSVARVVCLLEPSLKLVDLIHMQNGLFKMMSTCSTCGGSGKIVKNLCRACKGLKVVKGTKSIKLDIMPGLDENDTIKVYGSGGADPERNKPGDLYVTIKVQQDPVFRREKSDIHVDSVLNVIQAILGGTVHDPTLTGDVVLKVRPGTQPGQRAVLKGKGIKARNSAFYGNQYVHFDVTIPVNLSERQRMLIEEFAKEEQGEDKGAAAVGAFG